MSVDPSLIIQSTSHRPFPLPELPWFMVQQWSDLLFAHWAFPPEVIRPLVPEQLELDLHDSKAWVGLTPFRMTDLHLRGLPPIPGTGSFLEMNLRTYVRLTDGSPNGSRGLFREHTAPGTSAKDLNEKPGIFFWSLDASNIPAVIGARVEFGFPYFWADMSADKRPDGSLLYKSSRKQTKESAEVEVTYDSSGDLIQNKSDLERFLTERYCVYEDRLGVIWRTEIQHLPWPLQPATASFVRNTVGAPHKVPLTLQPDLLHISRQLGVLVFPPVPVT